MASPRSRRLPLLLAIVLVAISAGVTSGHHGGRAIGSLFNCDRPGVFPPRCTSVANDMRHRVFFDSTLTDGLRSSLRDAMAEDYDPTDFTVTEETELTSATDVVAYSQDYGDVGAAAWVYCPTDAPQGVNSEGDRWCRMQEIHFNLNSALFRLLRGRRQPRPRRLPRVRPHHRASPLGQPARERRPVRGHLHERQHAEWPDRASPDRHRPHQRLPLRGATAQQAHEDGVRPR